MGEMHCSNGVCEMSSCKSSQMETLDAYIKSLPLADNPTRKRGFLIQTLHRAQSIFGYLPVEVQSFVAERLGISLAEVYGVISFYSFFTDKPIGRYAINVCTGTACFVKGAAQVMDELKRKLGVSEGETTADGKYFLGALRCLGACSMAPVVMVNGRVYGHMTPEKVQGLLDDCKD